MSQVRYFERSRSAEEGIPRNLAFHSGYDPLDLYAGKQRPTNPNPRVWQRKEQRARWPRLEIHPFIVEKGQSMWAKLHRTRRGGGAISPISFKSSLANKRA